MTNDTHDAHDTPSDPRGCPVPAEVQASLARKANIQMLGTVAELLPGRGTDAGAGSDADRLLRILPDEVMLGLYRTVNDEDYAWQYVCWLNLPNSSDITRIRSARFREFLAQLFFERVGKVLKERAREDLLFVICGAIQAARDLKDAGETVG